MPLSRRPRVAPAMRLNYLCEPLETRRLLAVVFQTSSTITTSDGGGPVIFHPHVDIIFWGSGWNNNPSLSETALENMVSSVTSGPYLNDLTAYRAGMGSGFLNNEFVYTGSDPPANCPASAVHTLIKTLVNNGTVPRPNTDANLYYFIFPQPGTTNFTTSSGDAFGFHSYELDNQSNKIHFGCSINDSNIDTISTTFSHELAEGVTDPELNGITATVGQDNEICDGVSTGFGARLNGYQVNSYWLGPKNWIEVSTGVQSISFNGGNIQVNGDQLVGTDDTISLTTDPVTGGNTLTMNGESVTFLNGTANNTPLSFHINGLTGNDTVNIGQVVSSIPISVDGGTGTNALNITNTSFITDIYYNQVIGGGQAVQAFDHFQSLHITGGSAADEFQTFGNHPNETWVIDGGGGNDIINLAGDSNADTTVKGGDGNDFIDVKGAGNLVVDGGNGTDTLGDDPTFTGDIYSFVISNSIVIRTDNLNSIGNGTVNYSNVESLVANGGSHDDSFAISSTPGATTLNGNDGNDTFTFGNFLFPVPPSLIANLTMNGGNGLDTLSLDDEARSGGGIYSIGTGSLSNATNVSGPGFNYLYASFEGVLLTTGSGADSVTIGFCSGLSALTVNTSGGNDAVTYGSGGVIPNPSSVILDGGAGTNSVSLNDNSFPTTFNINFNVTASTVSETDFFGSGSFSYSNFAGVSVTGTTGADVFNVSSTAAGCPVAVVGNGGADTFNVSSNAPALTGDLAGLAAALSISGGTSSSIHISEAGQTVADNVTVNENNGLIFSNTLGWTIHFPGAANTGGISFTGGSGADQINVLSTFTGEPYNINGGDGDDTITLQMAGLAGPTTVDGGNGTDRFIAQDPSNAFASNAWAMNGFNVVRTTSAPAQTNSFGYANIEVAQFIGTPGVDTYAIQAANPGEGVLIDGEAGNDVYTIGTGTTSQMQGQVVIYGGNGGNDALIVDDSIDSTPRTLHIDAFTIGGDAGDNLFAGGGSVYASDMFGGTTVKCGSGADTIYALPNLTSPLMIQGNNPTTAPGDTLTLALASASNPVFTPGGVGAGSYTFSNFQPLSYTGIESVVADTVAPSVLQSFFDQDLAPNVLGIQFSENVAGSISAGTIQVSDLTTMTALSASYDPMNGYDAGTNTASFTLPGAAPAGLPDGTLSDGNYRVTIPATNVQDPAGNSMSGDYTFDFFVLSGDANHDRTVDTSDFTLLAQNFSQTTATFSQGDFNYDHVINALDFNILATHFGTTLAAPAPFIGSSPALLPAGSVNASLNLFGTVPVSLDNDRIDSKVADSAI